jgi:hypothetical protein
MSLSLLTLFLLVCSLVCIIALVKHGSYLLKLLRARRTRHAPRTSKGSSPGAHMLDNQTIIEAEVKSIGEYNIVEATRLPRGRGSGLSSLAEWLLPWFANRWRTLKQRKVQGAGFVMGVCSLVLWLLPRILSS